ncbi:MAG: hypothetical protein ACTSYZ_09805, partial [Candidatus Helarchaeota archaeon]
IILAEIVYFSKISSILDSNIYGTNKKITNGGKFLTFGRTGKVKKFLNCLFMNFNLLYIY